MKASSFGDAVWSGVNSLVENSAMGVSLDCIRKLMIEDKKDDAIMQCGIGALCTIINNRAFPKSGKYVTILAQKLRSYPKITIAKLKVWGITNDTIYSVAQTLLTDSEVQLVYKILNSKE